MVTNRLAPAVDTMEAAPRVRDFAARLKEHGENMASCAMCFEILYKLRLATSTHTAAILFVCEVGCMQERPSCGRLTSPKQPQ